MMEHPDTNVGNKTAASKTFNERWNEMYQRLLRFKERFGHCRVPNRFKEDSKLGAWVSAQRRHYKIMQAGEPSPMTRERIQQLNGIGFEWATIDPRHVSWEARFEELKEFKQKYGHVLVPIGWEVNPSLSHWVSAQRQDYKAFKKGRPSHMTEHKLKLLNDLGMVWEAQRGGRKRKLEPIDTDESSAASGEEKVAATDSKQEELKQDESKQREPLELRQFDSEAMISARAGFLSNALPDASLITRASPNAALLERHRNQLLMDTSMNSSSVAHQLLAREAVAATMSRIANPVASVAGTSAMERMLRASPPFLTNAELALRMLDRRPELNPLSSRLTEAFFPSAVPNPTTPFATDNIDLALRVLRGEATGLTAATRGDLTSVPLALNASNYASAARDMLGLSAAQAVVGSRVGLPTTRDISVEERRAVASQHAALNSPTRPEKRRKEDHHSNLVTDELFGIRNPSSPGNSDRSNRKR